MRLGLFPQHRPGDTMAISGIEGIASEAISFQTNAVGLDAVNDPALATEFEGWMSDPDMVVTPADGADIYQVVNWCNQSFSCRYYTYYWRKSP